MTSIFFSIVTPSLGNKSSLARALASVKDQIKPTDEHLIVTREQQDALPNISNSQRFVVQTVQSVGLYGALNQGFDAVHGPVLSWLNDDAQYLPGTLDYVHQFFDEHPEVDMVFGDFLVVDASGRLLAFR